MGMLLDFYNKIPVNIRAFTETFLGASDEITENDFSESDLDALRQVIMYKKSINDQKEAELKKYRSEFFNPEAYEKAKRLGYLDEYIAEGDEVNRQIESYKRTKNKTSVDYNDLDAFSRRYMDHDYFGEKSSDNSVISSFKDPFWRLSTSLGEFNAVQQKDGSFIIEDFYDWDAPEEGYSSEVIINALREENLLDPRIAGSMLMRVLRPESSRNVSIRLPSKN